MWSNWKKRFAYLPMRINRKKYIWLKTYYVRKGSIYGPGREFRFCDIERVETIFEVLQKEKA